MQRPLVETGGATLGRRAEVRRPDALAARHVWIEPAYQNATLADGSEEDLASDDFNDWGLRARAAYQISPIISPFVETVIDTRRYDDTVDFTGYERNSNGVARRAAA